MKASLDNPIYSVAIVSASTGTKYTITNALLGCTLSEDEDEIAQKVVLKIASIVYDSKYLNSHFKTRDTVYVYANTGDGAKEVFRGYIWTKNVSIGKGRYFVLTCYDNLIYLQESEIYRYFSKGKSTKSIFSTLCSARGIKLTYSHVSMTHPKLTLRGAMGSIFTNDLLEEVRKNKGKRGIIRSSKGRMYVYTEGKSNSTVYKLMKGKDGNVYSSEYDETLDGVTTKVTVITTKDSGKATTKATYKKNTDRYGTITKVLTSSSDNLSDTKKEAKQIIKDDSSAKITRKIKAVDNPWIRKGDKVYVDDGEMTGYASVVNISHDALNKNMSLEVRKL